jgi:hypothetical protein
MGRKEYQDQIWHREGIQLSVCGFSFVNELSEMLCRCISSPKVANVVSSLTINCVPITN